MKNIRVFLAENFQFLEVKFSLYLNRRVFVMRAAFFEKRDKTQLWCKNSENIPFIQNVTTAL